MMGLRDDILQRLPGSTAVTIAGDVLYPATVFVEPAAGDSVLCEYTVDGIAYKAWTAGTVTAFAADVLDGPVKALRFTRTAGSGTTSRVGLVPRK
jgi:hypothetical protein